MDEHALRREILVEKCRRAYDKSRTDDMPPWSELHLFLLSDGTSVIAAHPDYKPVRIWTDGTVRVVGPADVIDPMWPPRE